MRVLSEALFGTHIVDFRDTYRVGQPPRVRSIPRRLLLRERRGPRWNQGVPIFAIPR